MAIDSIVQWASTQPEWQQDALRRVALSSELTDKEISTILANLKRANGIVVEEAQYEKLQPLKKQHIQSDAQNTPLAHLCSIDNVKNANRLASNQTLSFAVDGLTLVYGQNGSGKSGYCRILKKFCRTLVKDTIHPNVFANEKSSPAEARIRYRLEGEEDVSETIWRDGEDGPSSVAHLSVFDSHNARLYVDERNQIDYVPYEIELLSRFGQLLTSLQENLSAEINTLDERIILSRPIGYTLDTPVFDLVKQLIPETPLEELPTLKKFNELSTWTEKNERDLEILQHGIGQNFQFLASRSRRVESVVANLIVELTKIHDLLSQANATELELAVRDAQKKTETATLSATAFFEKEPLSNIGSDPWEQMFQYAKKYSQLVYPDVEPPATRVGDLCVLCQQPLAEEAAARLRRFENYVTGQAKKDAQIAVAKLNEEIAGIDGARHLLMGDIKSLLGEYTEISNDRANIAKSVEKFFQMARKRRQKLLAAAKSGDFSKIVELDGSVIDELRIDREALSKEAIAYEAAAENDTDRESREKQLADLLDQKRLSENLEKIHARHNDLKLLAQLNKCVKGVRTNAVSFQVSALRKELVTEELNSRIRAEITEFELTHIPLRINDYSRKGESGVEVTLDTQQKVASRDVLSEGEQRALGLACFLADVNGQPVKHGIIVDDPVSSLDHVRIKRVAARLVNEAATGRQVIVFTHNLLFYSEVISLAAAKSPDSVPIHTNFIRKSARLGFGVVNQDEPWEAKPITKRLEHLKQKIKILESIDDDSEEYREGVKGFYSDLRESWERLVEEILLFKVVERYGSDVKTQRLKGVVVNDDDYKKVYWAMKRASEYSGHDIAAGKNLPLPNIEDLKKEESALDQYRLVIHNRSKATEKSRLVLEQPPKAETV